LNVKTALTRSAAGAQLSLKKNAPTIMTVAGVVGFTTTVVLAIQATTKANDVVPHLKEKIEEARAVEISEEVTEHDRMQGLVKAYLDAGLELVKLYGPTIATGSLSAALVISGHGMMRRREASLVAAYAALDAGFRAYRKRVQDELGPEHEMQLFRGPKMVEVQSDDGKTTVLVIDEAENMPSPYAKFFDESNVNWSHTAEYNLMFLRTQQQWLNDRLIAHGYVFLNEVYEQLGIERTQTGQLVGWKLKKTGLNDGFIDFGIYDISDPNCRAFVNGNETSILLDFNVDGIIGI
jgi:Family of unknown function (DUF6353)